MTQRKTGRIVRSISGFYDVQTGDGVFTCRARGILRRTDSSPLTGDLAEITVEKGKGMVEKLLPRKNSFIRPAVANVDALVVFAANVNPVTEPFLIDRVAAIAGDQEVPVYLCVNKCDLDPAVDLVRIYEHAGPGRGNLRGGHSGVFLFRYRSDGRDSEGESTICIPGLWGFPGQMSF